MRPNPGARAATYATAKVVSEVTEQNRLG